LPAAVGRKLLAVTVSLRKCLDPWELFYTGVQGYVILKEIFGYYLIYQKPEYILFPKIINLITDL